MLISDFPWFFGHLNLRHFRNSHPLEPVRYSNKLHNYDFNDSLIWILATSLRLNTHKKCFLYIHCQLACFFFHFWRCSICWAMSRISKCYTTMTTAIMHNLPQGYTFVCVSSLFYLCWADEGSGGGDQLIWHTHTHTHPANKHRLHEKRLNFNSFPCSSFHFALHIF